MDYCVGAAGSEVLSLVSLALGQAVWEVFNQSLKRFNTFVTFMVFSLGGMQLKCGLPSLDSVPYN